ncbi:unnamed protein product [Kuraishia capsulata CBS 1993]|uniref:DASH complex subunit DAD4 n=1 Tax=Kuraishia capsulata CBS 1993 TaxID=1382522 RepID=W6MVD8_9ASCO|nr:uncharacterized protein KUCA_T00005901001 [Kuraishia capsulata CBS 1993]CDK29907.1 unnamed protein product [Kuraishia capsulata CBS 1993]
MEDPYDTERKALFARIIHNFAMVNHSMKAMNNQLEQINTMNLETEIVCDMWETYTKNAQYHLKSSKKLSEPADILAAYSRQK